MTDPVRMQVTKWIQMRRRKTFRKSDLSSFLDATVSVFIFIINKITNEVSITCRYRLKNE